MRWRTPLGAALLVLLALPSTGFGWFHSLFSRPSRTAAVTAYYCPVPVIAVPVAVPTFTIAPVPVPAPAPPAAPPRLYAEPRPAPPSGSTPEPPLAPGAVPRAGVSGHESRRVDDNKYYDSYFVAGTRRAVADRCAVTFWNLSAQGLALTVDGQAHALPAGQSVRLDLKRDFTWGVARRDTQRQQVPAQESGLEIVIRR
jgi:hypothetical protein